MSVPWVTQPSRDFSFEDLWRLAKTRLAELLGLPESEVIVRPIADAWAPERYPHPSETPTVSTDVVIPGQGRDSPEVDLAMMVGLDASENEVQTVYINAVPGYFSVWESKSESGRALALATVLAAAELGRSNFEEAANLWPPGEVGPYEVDPTELLARLRRPLRSRPIPDAARELFEGTRIHIPEHPDEKDFKKSATSP